MHQLESRTIDPLATYGIPTGPQNPIQVGNDMITPFAPFDFPRNLRYGSARWIPVQRNTYSEAAALIEEHEAVRRKIAGVLRISLVHDRFLSIPSQVNSWTAQSPIAAINGGNPLPVRE